MTATFTVQLACANVERCAKRFPNTPTVASATDLRRRAAKCGWEVMRGTKGRELCPECRISEINAAAQGGKV